MIPSKFEGYIHVTPNNDLREHVVEGLDCWCHPREDDEVTMIVHNSMDQRELYEDGRLLPH